MQAKLSDIFKKWRWEYTFLIVIIATGIFLRTYHFSDWLLFEIDQTYDTRIVSQAIEEGPASLPLLGPTAGGGRALRLGPAFYYMEYASALIFGNTPTGHAILVLLSSILAMPIFYLFCRRYFSPFLAITLLALFSGSVYLVLYGRFSWSPNILPFLILLSFYALLRSVSETETKRGRWFLVAVTAITITSQIHFNAFFTIPTIAILFLLYKRPHFPLKTWALALGIITLIYSPMVMNDIVTHGENTSFFLKKISKGSSGSLIKHLPRKITVDLQYTASNFFFAVSGIDRINGGRLDGYGFENNANLPWRLLALTLFFLELLVLFQALRKESLPERRDFLVLITLWVIIPLAYFYSLIASNFQIYPRFFLLTAPAAIILLGLLFEKLSCKKECLRRDLLIGITLLLLVPNLMRVSHHFAQLAAPGSTKTTVETEDIFPNDKRLILSESLAVTDYLLAKQRENGYPIYLNTYHEYEPTLWYLLTKRGIPYRDKVDYDHLVSEGNYFLIQYPKDGRTGTERVFDISGKKQFGVLTVYTLTPKSDRVKALRQSPEDTRELLQTTQIRELKTWNDLFR